MIKSPEMQFTSTVTVGNNTVRLTAEMRECQGYDGLGNIQLSSDYEDC